MHKSAIVSLNRTKVKLCEYLNGTCPVGYKCTLFGVFAIETKQLEIEPRSP